VVDEQLIQVHDRLLEPGSRGPGAKKIEHPLEGLGTPGGTLEVQGAH
jgi:hypothetical protein